MNFKDLNIIPPILKAIDQAGYTAPTEIQKQSIPIVLSGKDIIGCAQTGTGKTASFAIPILQNLIDNPIVSSTIRTLILTPTRELAVQIDDNFTLYNKHLPLKHFAIYGGVNQKPQINAIKKGVDVLIATPGRLLDLVSQGFIKLNKIEILVLDEADRMLDMGFVNDIKKILKLVPAKKQTLFFSATMPKTIRKFALSILNDPKEVNVTPISSTANTIEQSVYFVNKKEKEVLLIDLLTANLDTRTLVFTRTKHGANKLVKLLDKAAIKSAAIHGNKSQNARQNALNDFKAEKIKVLIATDIAARGIDIDMLPNVINYELPDIAETYVHRIGRTGRAGKTGNAISFCSAEEKNDLVHIEKLIGLKIKVQKFEPQLELTTNQNENQMADSFSKKENNKKKAQKKQEKSLKREERKVNNNKGKSLEDMLVYVDINGNLTDVPPHLQNPEEDLRLRLESKNEGIIDPDKVYTGIINSLNEKGFGFITEDKTNESVFFHQSQLNGEVKKYNKVNYKKESSEKGFRAININKV